MIVIILLSLLLSQVLPAHAVSIHYGAEAPEFTLSSTDGEKVSLSEYKGDIVVLIYWDTEQDYSLEALDQCRDFFNAYKGKGVKFIGLIADTEDVPKARQIIKDYGIEFPVLIDVNRHVFSSYGISVYPTTIIIDRGGRYFNDIPGYAVTYETKLVGYLRHMLGEIDERELVELISLQRKVKAKSVSELSAERNYFLALKFAEEGLINHAITSAESSIESKPDMPRTHILLGFLFLEIKETELALQEFQRALELEPGSNDAKTGLGKAYILQDDIDGAIDALTAAVTANPNPQTAYYELGRAYELKGEKNKASEMYKKAVDGIIKESFLYYIPSQCK
jgi:peroxiredoxin